MGIMRRILGYAAAGAAAEAARRSWESETFIDSAFDAAEAGLLAETAKICLRDDEFWFGDEEEE